MKSQRRIRLLRDRQGQFVRIPRDLEFREQQVTIRKTSRGISLEAPPAKSLLEVLATLDPIDEDFPSFDDPPPEPVNL